MWLLIGLAGLFVAAMIGSMRSNLMQRWEDSEVVSAVEPQVIRQLELLPEDSEPVKVFGRFQRLSGSGFRHPGAWSLVDRIELDRVAHFEKGQVRTTILISGEVEPRDACRFFFTRWQDDATIQRLKNYSGPIYENSRVFYEHTYNVRVNGPESMHKQRNEYTLEVWAYRADARLNAK